MIANVFSIRKKLIVAFILIGVFPMLAATYIGVEIASKKLEKGFKERIRYAGKSAVYLLAQKKTELEGVARSFSEDPRLRKVIQGGVNIKFLWFDTPLQVYLFDHENRLIFSSTEESVPRPGAPEQGMTLLHTQGAAERWPLLIYLLPVSDQDQVIGTIMTGYSLNQEFLNDLERVTGVASILFEQDASGRYWNIRKEDRLDLDEEVLANVAVQGHQAFTRTAHIIQQEQKEAYYALLTPLPDAEGRVSYILFNGIPVSETLSGKLASVRFYYILIAVGLLLSVVVGSAVGTGISWPILRFSEGVRAISAGDYNQKIELKSRDEIGELAASFNLMTDRLKQTIAKLVENQNYTENILRSLLNGVMTIDMDDIIIRVNRAAEEILHLSTDELVGQKAHSVFGKNPEILSLLKSCLEHHQVKEGIETLLLRQDGESIPIELSLSPLEGPLGSEGQGTGVVVLFRDLSEIQALKEHIRRQDRLAALGELSAGIAHEIRNPLGIIKGAAGLLNKKSAGQGQRFSELSSVILEEVDRLNDVLNDFLEFARPRPPQFKRQKINELIRATLQVASMEIEKRKVLVRLDLDENLPPVMVDDHQIHQMFLNLILNALQATDEGDAVRITTRYLRDKGQVEVLFADTGLGIPEENLKKVFNPFFTARDEGVGLGLSVVSKIVENHHGKIFLSSQVGKGTQFAIYFPVAERFEAVYSQDEVGP